MWKSRHSPFLRLVLTLRLNKFASPVVDLSGIQENDMEKLASLVKCLLSSKVNNIDGIPIEMEDFLCIVSNVWQAQIRGTFQFQVNQKLKLLKVEFNKINKEKVGDVTIKAIEAKEQLSACQRRLNTNPLQD
ncbi:unnamed protein product [Ilex paraguariensis]|uniref:Uncharacterized protein n=1 Tax=Ilex paraguariensis TaxID=185542 RepID=A0ABC8TXT4_9AQUA